jgi:hypothetical protein
MDPNILNAWLLAAAAAACAVLWWLFRSLHAKVDQTDRDSNLAADWIKDDLAKYKLENAAYRTHIAETYVTASQFNTVVEKLFNKLDDIYKLLNAKADKE